MELEAILPPIIALGMRSEMEVPFSNHVKSSQVACTILKQNMISASLIIASYTRQIDLPCGELSVSSLHVDMWAWLLRCCSSASLVVSNSCNWSSCFQSSPMCSFCCSMYSFCFWIISCCWLVVSCLSWIGSDPCSVASALTCHGDSWLTSTICSVGSVTLCWTSASWIGATVASSVTCHGDSYLTCAISICSVGSVTLCWTSASWIGAAIAVGRWECTVNGGGIHFLPSFSSSCCIRIIPAWTSFSSSPPSSSNCFSFSLIRCCKDCIWVVSWCFSSFIIIYYYYYYCFTAYSKLEHKQE